MKTLVMATRNGHKVQEIRAILADQFDYLTLRDFPDAPAVREDAETFAGNAAKKADELARWLAAEWTSQVQRPKGKVQSGPVLVLADDSGLEVDALNGAPGVHSARFAALNEQDRARSAASDVGNSLDSANNAKLLGLLANVPWENRTAGFRCVLALIEVMPHTTLFTPHLFEGVCQGRISFAPCGQTGFGYDPLFVPNGCMQSFAELGAEVKNRLSHRAQALEKLRTWLLNDANAARMLAS